jgi:phage-related protein
LAKKWKKYGKLSYSSLITRISIQKKSQKTPQKEIKRAETIKKEYFKSKEAE